MSKQAIGLLIVIVVGIAILGLCFLILRFIPHDPSDPQKELEQIAKLIRDRRIELGLSRKELALRSNVAEVVIVSIERASKAVRPETLSRIKEALRLKNQST